MNNEGQRGMVESFKLLADVARLQIVGHLATAPSSAEALAERLALPEASLGKHLAKLSGAGLVWRDASDSRYHFQHKAWERLVREALSGSRRRLADLSDDEQLRAAYYTPDGRLRALPAQASKMRGVLRPLLAAFEPGERYKERDVNQRLSRFHEDVALLRRSLVDEGLLARQVQVGQVAIYWVAEGDGAP